MDSQESLWTERYINMQTGWIQGILLLPRKPILKELFILLEKPAD